MDITHNILSSTLSTSPGRNKKTLEKVTEIVVEKNNQTENVKCLGPGEPKGPLELFNQI